MISTVLALMPVTLTGRSRCTAASRCCTSRTAAMMSASSSASSAGDSARSIHRLLAMVVGVLAIGIGFCILASQLDVYFSKQILAHLPGLLLQETPVSGLCLLRHPVRGHWPGPLHLQSREPFAKEPLYMNIHNILLPMARFHLHTVEHIACMECGRQLVQVPVSRSASSASTARASWLRRVGPRGCVGLPFWTGRAFCCWAFAACALLAAAAGSAAAGAAAGAAVSGGPCSLSS